jgi:predicted dehydrogenase
LKTRKQQIGIIGCGGIATSKHLPSLAQLGDLCELTAFCDTTESRAAEAAKKYGVPGARVYTDYRQLLADGSLDAVHVLTPNNAHAPITVAAFEAGKHVLCEKPMAASSSDALKMVQAAEKSGKKFTVGYQNRLRSEVQTLKAACRSGQLGEIYFAKAHAIRRKAVPTWGVFQDKAQQGGGPLIDIGTHALDLTLWMMDNWKPKRVTGSVFAKLTDQTDGNLWGPWDINKFEVEDSAFAFIQMENGATVYLEASWILNVINPREAATTLCGTKGGAEILANEELVFNRATHGALLEERISGGSGPAYFGGVAQKPSDVEARGWLETLIHDKEPLVLPRQALVTTQILEAVYESHRQGGKGIEL